MAAKPDVMLRHYYAVCEPDEAGGFWISLPGRDGISSAAASAEEIVSQARDALETVLLPPAGKLPRSIEDGARPPAPADLADYDRPLVVVIPFEGSVAVQEAA
jgi:hypothetical protein